MTRPADLQEHERAHLDDLLASCPELTALAEHVRAFAELLTNRHGADLQGWMSRVDASDLPARHSFVRGLRKDPPAVIAGLSLPYSNAGVRAPVWKILNTAGIPAPRRAGPTWSQFPRAQAQLIATSPARHQRWLRA